MPDTLLILVLLGGCLLMHFFMHGKGHGGHGSHDHGSDPAGGHLHGPERIAARPAGGGCHGSHDSHGDHGVHAVSPQADGNRHEQAHEPAEPTVPHI